MQIVAFGNVILFSGKKIVLELMLSLLDKKFQHASFWNTFLIFLQKNRVKHFMQIVS